MKPTVPRKFARYKYVTVPISERAAKLKRKEEIKCLEVRIKELQGELRSLERSPLPKSRKKQIAIYPGQKEYDNLNIDLNSSEWQGDIVWKNIR